MTDDATLLAILDRDLAEAKSRSGPWLVCRPGCTDCCIGPFPITRLDARRLGRGLDELDALDPERAERVRSRARASAARLGDGFPGDRGTRRLDVEGAEPFLERHAGEPCPALDPATGLCDLYAWRPVSCRTYGPPARFGETLEPPCALCFTGASAEEVERCRIEFDRDGNEAALLERLDRKSARDAETLVAFALSSPTAVLP